MRRLRTRRPGILTIECLLYALVLCFRSMHGFVVVSYPEFPDRRRPVRYGDSGMVPGSDSELLASEDVACPFRPLGIVIPEKTGDKLINFGRSI